MKKWCVSTINNIVPDNSNEFMKDKPNKTQEELLEKVPKDYHSIIDIFMKCNADILPEHWEKNHIIQLEIGKKPLFIWNYKPLLDQENEAMIQVYSWALKKEFHML